MGACSSRGECEAGFIGTERVSCMAMKDIHFGVRLVGYRM